MLCHHPNNFWNTILTRRVECFDITSSIKSQDSIIWINSGTWLVIHRKKNSFDFITTSNPSLVGAIKKVWLPWGEIFLEVRPEKVWEAEPFSFKFQKGVANSGSNKRQGRGSVLCISWLLVWGCAPGPNIIFLISLINYRSRSLAQGTSTHQQHSTIVVEDAVADGGLRRGLQSIAPYPPQRTPPAQPHLPLWV